MNPRTHPGLALAANQVIAASKRPIRIPPGPPPMRASERELAVFVPMRLVNPLNKREHWSARAQRAKRHREAVAYSVWAALKNPLTGPRWYVIAAPTTPKRVHFHAHVARRFDTDGLVSACKAARDGLQDCQLIHDDGPDGGHVFTYSQTIAQPLGVVITVSVQGA